MNYYYCVEINLCSFPSFNCSGRRADLEFGATRIVWTFVLVSRCIQSEIPLWRRSAGICQRSRWTQMLLRWQQQFNRRQNNKRICCVRNMCGRHSSHRISAVAFNRFQLDMNVLFECIFLLQLTYYLYCKIDWSSVLSRVWSWNENSSNANERTSIQLNSFSN